jgi:hypothetical protein
MSHNSNRGKTDWVHFSSYDYEEGLAYLLYMRPHRSLMHSHEQKILQKTDNFDFDLPLFVYVYV